MVVKFTDDQSRFFTNQTLSCSFYYNLVFSGKINFLSIRILQLTQGVSRMIKDRKSFLKTTKKIRDRACMDKVIFFKNTKSVMNLLAKPKLYFYRQVTYV